ncbi:MAG TPA: hypothetical protein VGD66_09075 [Allosphingosinicella sp.]|jgi:hypothetical protein
MPMPRWTQRQIIAEEQEHHDLSDPTGEQRLLAEADQPGRDGIDGSGDLAGMRL